MGVLLGGVGSRLLAFIFLRSLVWLSYAYRLFGSSQGFVRLVELLESEEDDDRV